LARCKFWYIQTTPACQNIEDGSSREYHPSQRLLREDIIDKVLKRDMTALFEVRRVLDRSTPEFCAFPRRCFATGWESLN
jgi:hypothetical protein